MSTKDLVFVYGTLMTGGVNPATSFVNATKIGDGWINGRLYNLGWYPGYYPDYNIDAAVAPRVYGEVMEVDKDSLHTLDGYEGAPILYRRERTWVTMGEGDEETLVEAWVYVYNAEELLTRDRLIESGSWLEQEAA